MRLKLKIPFRKKKLSTIPTDEAMVEAAEVVKSYPLLYSNNHIQELLKRQFMTEKGVQLHPEKFLNEIIAEMEKGEPQTKEQFALYMHHKMASIVAPSKPPKRSFFNKRK